MYAWVLGGYGIDGNGGEGSWVVWGHAFDPAIGSDGPDPGTAVDGLVACFLTEGEGAAADSAAGFTLRYLDAGNSHVASHPPLECVLRIED